MAAINKVLAVLVTVLRFSGGIWHSVRSCRIRSGLEDHCNFFAQTDFCVVAHGVTDIVRNPGHYYK